MFSLLCTSLHSRFYDPEKFAARSFRNSDKKSRAYHPDSRTHAPALRLFRFCLPFTRNPREFRVVCIRHAQTAAPAGKQNDGETACHRVVCAQAVCISVAMISP